MKKIIKIIFGFIVATLAFMPINFNTTEVKAESKGYLSMSGFILEYGPYEYNFNKKSNNVYTLDLINSTWSEQTVAILDNNGNELKSYWSWDLGYPDFENPNCHVILHIVDDDNFNLYFFENNVPEEWEGLVFKSESAVSGGYYAKFGEIIFDDDLWETVERKTVYFVLPENGYHIKSVTDGTSQQCSLYNDRTNFYETDDSPLIEFEKDILDITISNLSVDSKVYDGTTAATIGHYDVTGIVEGDDVKVTATAEFEDAKAGNGKNVKVSFVITGNDAAKYSEIEDQYTVADIDKATPTYEVPTLEANVGDTLADLDLPDGFSFEDALTTSVGNVGNNIFKLTYTPSDTDNYQIVTGIDCTVVVKAAGDSEPSSDTPSEETKKSGCGGSIIATSFLTFSLALAGIIVITSKRKEE